MNINDVIVMMKFNLKDVVIMLEMLIITVLYFSGSMLTVQQSRGVKRTAYKVMNGALYTELAVVLLWVAFAIQL